MVLRDLLGPFGLAASLIVAAIFAVAAFAKLADLDGTRTAVREFGSPTSLIGTLAIGIPTIELIVAALLIYAPTRAAGGAGAIALLVVFSTAIALRLARGSTPECHCFGQLHSAPVSWKTLARNGVLTLLGATALSAGLAGKTTSLTALGRSVAGGSVLVPSLVVAVVMIFVVGAMLILSLLRSYGRVLLRVDNLERRLVEAGLIAEEIEDLSSRLGHAPGTTAPVFSAFDTDGVAVSLSDLLAPGLPLLLLFMTPDCGPCVALLPEVATWQREHAARLTIAIANGGQREAAIAEAAKNGLGRVVLDHDLAIYKSYNSAGTPGAVLISPDGTIASYLAVGSDSIRKLLDSAVSGEGDREVHALPIGSAVDSLILPDLAGKPVELIGNGKPTLILFWDPNCGFCKSMRDDLRKWERRKPAGSPSLVIVSSGDEASLRAEGFLSTVVLDADSSATARFNAGGTPMAMLIDSEGRIASHLAAGAEAVFALAGGRIPEDSGTEQLMAEATR